MQIRWKKRKRSLVVTVKPENEPDEKLIDATILILNRYLPTPAPAPTFAKFKPAKPKVGGTVPGALPPPPIW
jgi:hypothetical protein